MCTAITYKSKDFYFGRNLDLEYHYKEQVCITPRLFSFYFRNTDSIKSHNAIIGVATVSDGFPLYYEATNEKGLSIAGLNFPDNAHYFDVKKGCLNLAAFELIPFVLGCCDSVNEARSQLKNVNITNVNFSPAFTTTPLHWMLCDKRECIVIEQTIKGLEIFENPVGVLTNNPPFEYHLTNLNNYINLTAKVPQNRFSRSLDLRTYSRGMGAIGLPGDMSSASRFIKASFVRANSLVYETEQESVSQFFHILGAVEQQKGCVEINGKYEYTLYSTCCNTDKGVFYYKTYDNSQITAVDINKENLDTNTLICYPLITENQIKYQN